jgi:hypothetical protein
MMASLSPYHRYIPRLPYLGREGGFRREGLNRWVRKRWMGSTETDALLIRDTRA